MARHHGEQIVHRQLEFTGLCACRTLIRESQERVQYKQSRAGPMDRRPTCVARGASPSGGHSSFMVSKTAAYTRSLSGPVRAGASKNQGAFRLKLRLKPPSLVGGSSVADRTLSDLPFSGAGGRLRSQYPAPRHMPVRLVNLPLWRTFPATGRILKEAGKKICNAHHGCE